MRKPYRSPTYSQKAPRCCISIEDQAQEYALWLTKNDRHHCAVYPMKKNPLATSNQFREWLVMFHEGPLRFKEVDPSRFLGPYKAIVGDA